MSDFHVEVKLTARKDHTCCECHGVISKGAEYTRSGGAQDGQGFSYKTCLPCTEARKWLDGQLRLMNSLNDDEGIEFGGLHSELAEFASEERFLGAESLRHLLGIVERRHFKEQQQ